jgi:patatin-like phospholipase/acyl hydrolase
MADYKQTRAPLDPAATPTNPVRLLSLDGGGVKGISPLLILDAIMREIRDKENALSKNPDPSERLPVDYFNLAAGTSTGGLIALMLFRLRMSTTEVMNTYDSLAKEVFSPTMFGFELHRLGRPGYWAGNVVLVIKTLFQKSQFSDKPLLQAIDKVVYDYPLEKEDRDLKGKARLVHKKAGKLYVLRPRDLEFG